MARKLRIRVPSTMPVQSTLLNGSAKANSLSGAGEVSLRQKVRQAARQVEAELIMEALERHRWNRRRTAEALKISYRSLMYKMKTCNLRDAALIEGHEREVGCAD